MTNLFRNSIFAFFLTGLFVATMFGCGGSQAAKTGFLKDYSQLKPRPEIEGRHRYINPNFDCTSSEPFGQSVGCCLTPHLPVSNHLRTI